MSTLYGCLILLASLGACALVGWLADRDPNDSLGSRIWRGFLILVGLAVFLGCAHGLGELLT